MKKIIGILLVIFAIRLTVYSQQHLNPEVATWEAKFEFDNELYPSYVLARTGPANNANLPSDYIGDPAGFVEVWIVSSVPNAQVHVEIRVEGWASPSELDATLPEAGKRYRLAPFVRYDFVRLAETNQSYPGTVDYSVRVNGIDLGKEMMSIRIRSANDVPFYTETSLSGGPVDNKYIFAGFVNESHPSIRVLLQEALKWKAVNSFSGYQADAAGVRMQVFAIWNALQRRHVKYSGITTPSASSPSGKVYSQAVRFIDESIDSQQANCVDGSVLFASILYKIGIEPLLVLKPSHMFVGYYLDENHSSVEFLETTAIGSGHQPGQSNIAFSKILHPVALSESWAQFVNAIQYANNAYSQEVAPALRIKKAGYQLIDIAQFRRAGINAIPRPGK
jgi:hypothetical protein